MQSIRLAKEKKNFFEEQKVKKNISFGHIYATTEEATDTDKYIFYNHLEYTFRSM